MHGPMENANALEPHLCQLAGTDSVPACGLSDSLHHSWIRMLPRITSIHALYHTLPNFPGCGSVQVSDICIPIDADASTAEQGVC